MLSEKLSVSLQKTKENWHPRRWLQFLRLIGLDTGQTKRIGWSAIGFSHDEQDNLAEHEYNLSLECFLLDLHLKLSGITNLDGETMISMPMQHDNTELRGGDIGTPRGQDYPDLKTASREIELIAQAEYCELLKHDHIAQAYTKLVVAERDQTSDEARIVKIMDRLEAWLHLQKKDPSPWCKKHEQYFNNTVRRGAESIKNPQLKLLMHKIIDSFIRLHKQGRLGRRIPITKPKDTVEDRLVVLFDELQLTKAISRTSWTAAGLKTFEHDNLAMHGHAGVAAVWLLGEVAKEQQMQYNSREALAMALVRDLGKMYGGDVSVASISKHDPMRQASRKIRKIAFQIIVSKLGNEEMQRELCRLHDEAMIQETDMARSQMVGARIMDLMFYDKARHPNYDKKDARKFFERYRKRKINPLIRGMTNPGIRTLHEELAENWMDLIREGDARKPLHSILGKNGKKACLK